MLPLYGGPLEAMFYFDFFAFCRTPKSKMLTTITPPPPPLILLKPSTIC